MEEGIVNYVEQPLFYAFNPGLAAASGTGLAEFRYGRLTAVEVCAPQSARLEDKLAALRAWRGVLALGAPVIIEHMRSYSFQRQKGDQNDLLDLAVVEGILIGDALEFELVEPRTWKGTRPKDVQAEKVTMPALKPEEAVLLGSVRGKRVHNAVDAVGIGLWALKRI